MNLRVDLILESEQRSASMLSVKSFIRVGTIVVPLILALLLAFAIIGVLQLKNQCRSLSSEWEMIKPQGEAADRELQNCRENVALLREVEGWGKSRLSWSKQLAGIVDVVPSNTQLSSMRISQTIRIEEGKSPARSFSMDIKGTAVGVGAEESVRLLEQRLRQNAPFAAAVESVTVPLYGADPSKEASRNDRIFAISCIYRACSFQ